MVARTAMANVAAVKGRLRSNVCIDVSDHTTEFSRALPASRIVDAT